MVYILSHHKTTRKRHESTVPHHPHFLLHNPHPSSTMAGRHGTWYINNRFIPGHLVNRRDPDYYPFQSVVDYTNHPFSPYTPELSVLPGAGFLTHDEWSFIRPNVWHWQAWEDGGARASGPGMDWPWYFTEPLHPDWPLLTNRIMQWYWEGEDAWT